MASNDIISVKIDKKEFQRYFTKLYYEFPKECGRVARRLGFNIRQALIKAQAKGKNTTSRLLSFNGNWQRHNPLYKLIKQLTTKQPVNEFGGKLNQNSPITYFWDEANISTGIGYFKNVPSYKKPRKGEGVGTNSRALKAIEKFQSGKQDRRTFTADERKNYYYFLYKKMTEQGYSKTEINKNMRMAQIELNKGWTTPQRDLFNTVINTNYNNWLNYIITQVDYIIEQKENKK